MFQSKLLYCSCLAIALAFSTSSVDAQNQGSASRQGSATRQASPMPQADGSQTINMSDNGQAEGNAYFNAVNQNTASACGGACGDANCGNGCRPGFGRLRGILPSVQLSSNGCCSDCCTYRSVFGGWSELDDFASTVTAAPLVSGVFNDGFILGTARGRYLNNNNRIELEGSWRGNSGGAGIYNGAPALIDGHFNNFSTMVNVLHDFGNGQIKPYVGAGIGVSRQDGEFTVVGNNLDFDDWAFAYQAIGGVSVQSSQNMEYFTEYRFFGNSETEIELNGVVVGDFEYLSESIVFGIRFKR